VTAWVVVGIAAGIASWAAVDVIAPAAEGQGLLVQIGRGLVRHVPTGIAYQLATGAAARAAADGAALEDSLAVAHERRSRLLARAEAIERYASEALHRTAQGRLTAAAALARMDRREEALREIAQVRDVTLPSIVERLASADLEDDELADAAAPAGIEVVDGIDWAEVGATYPAIASPLRRVIDECLVNAQRHGGARRVEISLAVTDRALRLECRDDGTGVAPGGPRAAGLGSRLFDEMCSRFGGSWTLAARPDGTRGASFTLTVPVARPAGDGGSDEAGGAGRGRRLASA
jgi:signal transduction histidine kinase